MPKNRHLGITLAGSFAVVAGIGEIVVGFTGNYLHILSHPMPHSLSTAVVGVFYSLGGLFILTKKRWGAILGILFVGAEIAGRIYLVSRGIAPSMGFDAAKIFIGGTIAFALILYVLSQWKKFE